MVHNLCLPRARPLDKYFVSCSSLKWLRRWLLMYHVGDWDKNSAGLKRDHSHCTSSSWARVPWAANGLAVDTSDEKLLVGRALYAACLTDHVPALVASLFPTRLIGWPIKTLHTSVQSQVVVAAQTLLCACAQCFLHSLPGGAGGGRSHRTVRIAKELPCILSTRLESRKHRVAVFAGLIMLRMVARLVCNLSWASSGTGQPRSVFDTPHHARTDHTSLAVVVLQSQAYQRITEGASGDSRPLDSKAFQRNFLEAFPLMVRPCSRRWKPCPLAFGAVLALVLCVFFSFLFAVFGGGRLALKDAVSAGKHNGDVCVCLRAFMHDILSWLRPRLRADR